MADASEAWPSARRSWVLLHLVREFESESIPADLIESILDRNRGDMTAAFLELQALADQDFCPDFTKVQPKWKSSKSNSPANAQTRFDYGEQTPNHFLSYADAMNDARIVGSEKTLPIRSTLSYQAFATELGVRQMFVRHLADLWSGFDYEVNLQYTPASESNSQTKQFKELGDWIQSDLSLESLKAEWPWKTKPEQKENARRSEKDAPPLGTLKMEFYNP